MLGPKLPYFLFGSAMVTSTNGRGVVLIGGYNASEYKYSTTILELNNNTMKWVALNQTLKYARKWHVALPIPDELTNCTKIKMDRTTTSTITTTVSTSSSTLTTKTSE